MNAHRRPPTFERPPVTEVALSLQFEELSGLTSIHFGPLWDIFRERYPRIEQQPPLARMAERFDETSSQPQLQVQFVTSQMLPRYWFVSESGNELVQVQQDRFAYNWRKNAEDAVYPGYPILRERLIEEIRLFQGFVTDAGVGDLSFDQCEVTYVNQLSPGAVWRRPADIGRVLSFWSDDPDVFGDLEAVRVATQDRRLGAEGAPVGRLYFEAGTAIRGVDGALILSLNLVGRGAPASASLVDALTMVDAEHDWVIDKFLDVTTEEVQRDWGRTDG
jgi:hypothetical protein